MHLYSDPDHYRHAPPHELKAGQLGAANEGPDRLDAVMKALKEKGFPDPLPPEDHGLDPIKAVHKLDYIHFMQEVWPRWRAAGRTGDIVPLVWPGSAMRRDVQPHTIDGLIGLYSFDSGTPITRHTYKVAYTAAQCAVSAAKAIALGETDHAVCLTRPPGHHAMPAAYGGYCFFNQAAIAAQTLLDAGKTRVAILDVDYHHGNGTQAIFYDRSDVLVVNIHADPEEEYPYFLGHGDETGEGPGEGFTLNLPQPKGIGWSHYKEQLNIGLQTITHYQPEALIISLGVDTGFDDPLGYFNLAHEDFARIGALISGLNLPRVTVLEGGYDRKNIGAYVSAYLRAAQ